jgi:ATP-dependent helicase YprA (DUF1998 family)
MNYKQQYEQSSMAGMHIGYSWQLDVGEALHLGLNCFVIAGTGEGKTLPFVMPLLHDKMDCKVISPLNALEEDQISISSIPYSDFYLTQFYSRPQDSSRWV